MKQKLDTFRWTKCFATISSAMSVSPRSTPQPRAHRQHDSVQFRWMVLCWVMHSKHARQNGSVTSEACSGSVEMA